MILCTKKLEFDAAHRIPKHVAKCKMLHGHRYVIEASFQNKEYSSNNLNEMGMVIDFGIIKTLLTDWINTYWDHNVILSIEDQKLGEQIQKYTGQKVYYMDSYPTSENMSNLLLNKIIPELFKNYNVLCSKVKLHETPNSYSEAFLELI